MKTVEIYEATGIVKNVFRPIPGTPFDPDPGVVLLSVSDAIDVYAGLRHVPGSNPPEFQEVPIEEVVVGPADFGNDADGLDAMEKTLRDGLSVVERLRELRG